MVKVTNSNQIQSKPTCPNCHKQFANKSCVERHISERSCRVLNPHPKKEAYKHNPDLVKQCQDLNYSMTTVNDSMKSFNESLKSLDEKMKAMEVIIKEAVKEGVEKGIKTGMEKIMIEAKPVTANTRNTRNSNLDIIYLGENDNLIDILSLSRGMNDNIIHIKDCVFGKLADDYRILAKVYLPKDQLRTNCFYHNGKPWRVETNAIVNAKRSADTLNISYLNALDSLKNKSRWQTIANTI